MGELRERFADAHNLLSARVDRFFLWDVQVIPDLLFYHLALDVLEQGRAVAVLTDGKVGRPGYANSRAAFEAAMDMVLLVASPEAYCAMGAKARAWELVDVERLQARRDTTDSILGLEPEEPLPSPEQVVEDEATVWDGYSPGRGQLLRDALSGARALRLGSHWSGLTRAKVRERVESIAGEPSGVKEMLDTFYGMQSIHTHPGSRLGLRDTTIREDGSLFVAPREMDLLGPMAFSTMAADLANIAIARRPAPADTRAA